MKSTGSVCSKLIGTFAAFLAVVAAWAQGPTVLSYQGNLMDAGLTANGAYDFRFYLVTAATGGTTLDIRCADNVEVVNGQFALEMDFGNQFSGERWLRPFVRRDTGLNCNDNGGWVEVLPRQRLTATPYAISAVAAQSATTALTATTATNATQLNGQPPTFFQNATNLTSGTISNSRLTTEVARRDLVNTFTGSTNSFGGNVVVGSTAITPQGPLHVFEGDAGTTSANSNASVVIEDSTATYLNFMTPATVENGVLFGIQGNNASGGIIYNNPSTPEGLQLRTGGNSTKAVLTETGNLGVGTISPAEKLHVAGNARIDGTITIPVTTRAIVTSAAGFNMTTATGSFFVAGTTPYINGSNGFSGDPVQAVAPISLPDGATLTSISGVFRDSSSGHNFTVRLKRQSFGSPEAATAVIMGSVQSQDLATPHTATDATISSPVIDAENFGYWLQLDGTVAAGGETLRFFSVKVTYTVTQPLP